ncbi:MAG: hypothetical protein IRZ07_19440 [Microbispora sp.]|nr:hypothetical protein [Microbispora sp.]
MTIAPGTDIYPAMSPKRMLERFPVGAGVTSVRADRGVGAVIPAGSAPEGAAARTTI